MRRIAVLGVQAGAVPPGSEPALAAARVVAGGRAALDLLAPAGAERVVIGADVDAALDELDAADGPAVVLASGDPGQHGILRRLAARHGREALDVRPAPSFAALALARLGLPADDALVVSAHARADDRRVALHTALRWPVCCVLTGPQGDAAWLLAGLRGSDRRVAVCERLGTAEERIVEGTPEELALRSFATPNVLVTWSPDAARPAWPPRTPAAGWGLDEDAFAHRSGMVTKAEVRALALAHLGPGLGDLVWDVGCGSGSVAVECARLGAAVIALDHDTDAVDLCARNAVAHGVPVRTLSGQAPAALADLPDPDCAFVGGGGADLDAIVEEAARRTRRAVVVTLATIERAGPVLERLAAAGLDAGGTMLQANRLAPLAGGHRLAATNPVVVLWGTR